MKLLIARKISAGNATLVDIVGFVVVGTQWEPDEELMKSVRDLFDALRRSTRGRGDSGEETPESQWEEMSVAES